MSSEEDRGLGIAAGLLGDLGGIFSSFSVPISFLLTGLSKQKND